MSLKSPKQKGSRLERRIAQLIRHKGLDKYASRMPLSGAYWCMKEDIKTDLPYHIEAKNCERLQIWKWWAKIREYKNPVLVFSGNHRPDLACMDLDLWLNLLKEIQDLKQERRKLTKALNELE